MMKHRKSFRIVFIRNFVGTIFAILIAVYALFNIITNNFISDEAYEEFSRHMSYLEDIDIAEPTIIIQVSGFRYNLDALFLQWQQMQSIRQLMMNADGVLIDPSGNIAFPELDNLTASVAYEISYIADYFIANSHNFLNQEMNRVSTLEHVYYVMAIEFPIGGDLYFSFLLYTDITSATAFMDNINRSLLMVLVVSGLFSIFLSIIISNHVLAFIIRLEEYAKLIGLGKFNEKIENFHYSEFNALADSMNHMSEMLNTYENNQKQFFQNVSHELRTPLMSIKGYAEGIAENVLDINEATSIILEESDRMEQLVSQLLYISRMDSGLDEFEVLPLNLRLFFNDLLWRMKMLSSKHGVEIVLDMPANDVVIDTDESKMQVAIDNIVTNCLRYARSKVWVRVDGFRIVIEDDGDGIPDGDLPSVFDRFYKGHNGNTGLGLAITKDILERLGYGVSVCNGEGGARFVIILA